VHRLIPRHRRKAGSGPPANALIAWIGTDPYLRDAAATASYRRWTALPTPSSTRSAGAAVVTCFALACAAVLGITAIISHGRASAQHKIDTPSLFGPGGGALTHGTEPSLAHPGEGSEVPPAATGTAPTLAERAAPQPIPVPPAISSRHLDIPSNASKPVDRVETVAADQPSDSSDAGPPSDAHILLADSEPSGLDAPANPGTPHSGGPANPGVPDNRDDPVHQRDPATLTIPGTHRSRSETSEPTPTGRIKDTDVQGATGDPGTGRLSLSPRRSTSGLRLDSAHTPASDGGSIMGYSSISRQGSAPAQKSTSHQSSRPSRR
jgi:hypothetical protein